MENQLVLFAKLPQDVQAVILRAQRDEETGALIYAFMAKREKDAENSAVLRRMSDDEKSHADFWKSISGQAVRPNRWKVLRLRMLTRLLGYTFVLKRIAQDEKLAVSGYDKLVATMPDAARIKQDEERHEQELIQLLNEERLQYVGSMVLGLNDALVELTGTIAGLSFALQNTGMVALSGIITGVSATLSMAASNYLAERADNNPNALKSSIYTGVAYLITVALLVLPYLILPNNLWFLALIMMIAIVVLVILAFNYYVSVAKSVPFRKRFIEMVSISMGVAVIAFLIGLLAKALLGVNVG